MPETALVITHGGHGTVARALMHLKPLIVVPHGRDQNDNAARVTARGAGIMLPASAAPSDFRAAIETGLADPAYPAAAKSLGERVADEVKRSLVAEELEQLVAYGRGRREAA
jgi:UDP:flavonoid glycosyltransferase YjiC (YdhE family)